MAKPYSDDLRRKFLEALEQGEGSEPELAGRFRVSRYRSAPGHYRR
jgi:transposase